jgi:hypothetical protein
LSRSDGLAEKVFMTELLMRADRAHAGPARGGGVCQENAPCQEWNIL